jgi:lysozyme family protein
MIMTVFDDAFDSLMEFEGGYSNDPDDVGGETKFGIAQRFNPEIDIKNLTKETAKEYYRKRWWERYNYNLIAQPEIAKKAFITAVNLGAMDANILLQKAANECTREGLYIKTDGSIGKYTLSTMNGINPEQLLDKYRIIIAKNYILKVKKDPNKKKYICGWIDRALS